MNDHPSNSGAQLSDDPLSPRKSSLSADALARRRLMLRGASSGAAALAALKPMGALATGTGGSTVLVCKNASNKDALCTLSGVQSAAHSFGPNITKITAGGKKTTHWSSRTGSGPGTPINTWPSSCSSVCAPGKTVGSLLAGCNSSYTNTKMLDLLNHSTAGNSTEAHFIVAYLNAALLYSSTGPTLSKTFPYSMDQVKSFWTAGGTTRTNARDLFKAIATL